jgi:hypothetical protein
VNLSVIFLGKPTARNILLASSTLSRNKTLLLYLSNCLFIFTIGKCNLFNSKTFVFIPFHFPLHANQGLKALNVLLIRQFRLTHEEQAKRPYGALSIAQGNALWNKCNPKQSGCKPDIKKLIAPLQDIHIIGRLS